jgi:hypothetical protein
MLCVRWRGVEVCKRWMYIDRPRTLQMDMRQGTDPFLGLILRMLLHEYPSAQFPHEESVTVSAICSARKTIFDGMLSYSLWSLSLRVQRNDAVFSRLAPLHLCACICGLAC